MTLKQLEVDLLNTGYKILLWTCDDYGSMNQTTCKCFVDAPSADIEP